MPINQHYKYNPFFFFYWRYNPLWVLAFSVILFHSVLSLHNFFHRLIPIICVSSLISSIRINTIPASCNTMVIQSVLHLSTPSLAYIRSQNKNPRLISIPKHEAPKIPPYTLHPISPYPDYHSSISTECPKTTTS